LRRISEELIAVIIGTIVITVIHGFLFLDAE
jgi:hypothetical protein